MTIQKLSYKDVENRYFGWNAKSKVALPHIYVKYKFIIYEVNPSVDQGGNINVENGHIIVELRKNRKTLKKSILQLRDCQFLTDKNFFFEVYNNIWS